MMSTATEGKTYKGKVTHRSWPQLPEELIRHIATFYLWDLSATNYCPQVWDARENWHSRMVYAALRDASNVEKCLMSICPQWSLALESHLFWQQAIALIDPMDYLGHHAIIHHKPTSLTSSSAPAHFTRMSPHRHFRNITSCSCIVCRLNSPTTNMGLTLAKRTIGTPFLGLVTLCREHDRRRVSFCGLCLRDAALHESSMGGNATAADNLASCLENEDEETWPGVEATCRTCRSEWLWRRICNNPKDREAIGGSKMTSEDWETRQHVEGFVDLAEGSIADVISLAREKWWLRKNTRLGDMMMQALAATRFNSGRTYDRNDLSEVGEEEEEDDEEDVELMQLTEEGGVRDLALGDWARMRILDGHWFSPADQWYDNALPGRPMAVRAVHPCPWTLESTASDEDHPKETTIRADMPPSYALCEQAYIAHQRQMRVVLLPAMRNIVRRVVIECAGDGIVGGTVEDPALRASRMSLEDVLTALRTEEGVWFDGVDWAERRRNDGRLQRQRDMKREKRVREDAVSGSDDSSTTSSSKSGRSSNATSPVLSTTTLQTTPSPPPLSDEGCRKDEDFVQPSPPSRPVTIAISPVLDPPRLIRPIPYVPLTVSHMPHYSLEAFRAVWREACAPLYHCRCSVCERAMAKANATNGNAPVVPSQVPSTKPSEPSSDRTEPTEIRLDETVDLDGEGEDEVDVVEREADDEEEDERDEVEESDSHYEDEERYMVPRSRKRSCSELDEQHDQDADPEVNGTLLHRRDGTPPKRARREVAAMAVRSKPRLLSSPMSMRKRSSEELDHGGGEDMCVVNKRIKMSPVESEDHEDATTASPPSTSDSYSLLPAVEDEIDDEPAGFDSDHQVSEADLDQLYVLSDE